MWGRKRREIEMLRRLLRVAEDKLEDPIDGVFIGADGHIEHREVPTSAPSKIQTPTFTMEVKKIDVDDLVTGAGLEFTMRLFSRKGRPIAVYEECEGEHIDLSKMQGFHLHML